ncbi:MAG: hypothetical protein VKN33_10300 [Candidatus Sericytochromatia bacterium]|nr:hypothetical protein [Candidatus Sericytochromatia bacterium]
MESILLGCFAVGLLFSLVSGLLSASHGGLEGEIFGKLTPPGVEGSQEFGLPSLNLSAFMVFLTWFGGVSWVTLVATPLGLFPSLLLGISFGAPAYWGVNKFFNTLSKSHSLRDPADDELAGTLAKVSVGIPAGGVGEIVFSKHGSQRVEAARGEGSDAIPKGGEVVILTYQRGVAVVQPSGEFFDDKSGV